MAPEYETDDDGKPIEHEFTDSERNSWVVRRESGGGYYHRPGTELRVDFSGYVFTSRSGLPTRRVRWDRVPPAPGGFRHATPALLAEYFRWARGGILPEGGGVTPQ